MKPHICVILFLLNLSSLFAQGEIHEKLIYVKEGDKIGFIDFNGKEVVPVEFDAVKWFSENMLPVNKGATEKSYEPFGGKWGFWSRDGQEIIPLKYDDAKIFREGLAPVKLDGKYGYISPEGEVQIGFKYEDAEPFRENLAAVKIDGKWGFINKNGNFVISPGFHSVGDFDNGFSVVFHFREKYEYEEDGNTYTEEYGTYGLIDKSGKLRLDTVYDYIGEFVNGFAKIALEGKEGFINSSGEIAIPIQFDIVEKFSEGLAAVGNYMVRDSYYDFGYTKEQIDSLAQEVKKLFNEHGNDSKDIFIHPTYMEFQRANKQAPSEELVYGYINEAGEVVIDFQFDEADEFKNGLAKVRFGDVPMFRLVGLDSMGNPLPSYQEQTGIGVNLIDSDGTLQFENTKEIINRYQDSLLIVYTYNGTVAYNESLEEVISTSYQNLKYIGSDFFIGELRGTKRKVLIRDGIEIELNENFWDLEGTSGENRILVDYIIKREGNRVVTKSGIIDENGAWILEPKYDFSMMEFSRK